MKPENILQLFNNTNQDNIIFEYLSNLKTCVEILAERIDYLEDEIKKLKKSDPVPRKDFFDKSASMC